MISKYFPPNLITSVIRGWYYEKRNTKPPVYEYGGLRLKKIGRLAARNNFTQLASSRTYKIGCAIGRYYLWILLYFMILIWMIFCIPDIVVDMKWHVIIFHMNIIISFITENRWLNAQIFSHSKIWNLSICAHPDGVVMSNSFLHFLWWNTFDIFPGGSRNAATFVFVFVLLIIFVINAE